MIRRLAFQSTIAAILLCGDRAFAALLLPSCPRRRAMVRRAGGNDTNSCLTQPRHARRSTAPYARAASGDTIYVAVGAYTDVGDQVVLVEKGAALSGGWNDAFTVAGGHVCRGWSGCAAGHYREQRCVCHRSSVSSSRTADRQRRRNCQQRGRSAE